MNTSKFTEEQIRTAEKRVNERIDFFIHLIIYIAVNILLAAINLLSNPDEIWFIFPLFGWGIGLLFHFLSVFVFDQMFDGYRKKSLAKELEKVTTK